MFVVLLNIVSGCQEKDRLLRKQSLFIFQCLSLTRSLGLKDSGESCLESPNNHIWSKTIRRTPRLSPVAHRDLCVVKGAGRNQLASLLSLLHFSRALIHLHWVYTFFSPTDRHSSAEQSLIGIYLQSVIVNRAMANGWLFSDIVSVHRKST